MIVANMLLLRRSILLLLLSLILLYVPCTRGAPNYIPSASWADSYSVDGECYCRTTYDHAIGPVLVDTPAGNKTVLEVCKAIGKGPGAKEDTPVYNDVQCGNGPANDAGDETACPGRVDLGEDGCGDIGPRWNLSMFVNALPETGVEGMDLRENDENDEENLTVEIPGAFDADKFVIRRGGDLQDTEDADGEEHLSHVGNDAMVEYNVSVLETGTYNCTATVATPGKGGRIVMWDGGSYLTTLKVTTTGGWQTWENVTSLVELNSTMSSLRLVFAGDLETHLFNVRTFYFEPAEDE
eukprot:Plantae.Rhodophyta-Hildenbrandia_rubra.ctg15954.p1 GENE.Plantae.Rhodophyta-Hildenbrandia_rubra.ctg15954~~Plantae.Rhodophyta-Hildenbrandia_rubra.ctg15954.p1  ORF type:complete len:296 (-),score=46.77 Plantae.Rhodophyta-Hildenbrandia_rubra.ctg15954:877-1764(-)